MALAWVLAQANITAPIFGATQPEHIDDALAAIEVTLEEQDLTYLEAAYAPSAL